MEVRAARPCGPTTGVSLPIAGALATGIAVAALLLACAIRGPVLRTVRLRHPDSDPLSDAGWSAGLGRWELTRAGIVVGALVVAVAVGLPLLVVPAAAFAPSVWIRLRAEAARERARRSITRVVAGTEAALRSGVTLPDALRREAEATTDPLARRTVLEALAAFDLGASLDAGLRTAALGSRDRRVVLAFETLALGIDERLPRERLADLLRGLVDRLSFEEGLDDEVRARASGARQQQRLLALLVPAIAVFLIATMPSLAAALDTPLGRFVLVPGAIAFEIAGIMLARRIVNEALA